MTLSQYSDDGKRIFQYSAYCPICSGKMLALTDSEALWDFPSFQRDSRDKLHDSIRQASIRGRKNGLNVFCENCRVAFRFALHSQVSPIYREAAQKDPANNNKPNGNLIYQMVVDREMQEALIYHGVPPIDIPSPPLQIAELKVRDAAALRTKKSSTTRQGDLGTFFCPVCNRKTSQWFRGASPNEIEVSCDACRASFHMTRTDGGHWSSISFSPQKKDKKNDIRKLSYYISYLFMF